MKLLISTTTKQNRCNKIMIEEHASESKIAQKLELLAELYRQGQASEMATRTLNKLLAYEAETCRKQLQQLKADLSVFEQRYKISSAQFYKRFQQGQTEDSMDFVEWASIVQMARRLENRLELLSAEENM